MNTHECIRAYDKYKNLKLAADEIGMKWQKLYTVLIKEGVKVTGDKARYGSASDRIAVIGEQIFKETIPEAIDNNNFKYQATIDFTVLDYTVDVKTSKLQHKTDKHKSTERWAYCINKQKDIAEFFVFYALDDDLKPIHIFLMPNEIVTTATSVSIPASKNSKWFDYEVTKEDLQDFFKSLPKKETIQ